MMGAVVTLALVLLGLAAFGMASWPNGIFLPLALVLSIGAVALQGWAYARWIDQRRPASDLIRLKAYLESDGARVLSTASAGVRVTGRSGPDWRNYRAKVRLADGQEVDRLIGVEVSFMGRPAVHDYDHPKRIDYFSG
jgi:hypothetical protein